MSRLLTESTPAERKRGCRFSDHFRSLANVQENGGAATGAPVFSMSTGVTLDGAADFLTYNLAATEFDDPEISIVVEFTPAFDWDANADYYIFDTTNALEYSAVKEDNAAVNVLTITLGNTALTSIPAATFSPAWLVGARNVLVISGTTGANDVWLNGTQIMTAEATAWTADRPTELIVGAEQAGGSFFEGIIHSLQVYKALLTAQESDDFYNRTTYSYNESLLGIWQMRAADHDPVGALTLDTSGNGADLDLISAPPKIARHHGYTLDGAADYFTNAGMDMNSATLSWVLEMTPAFDFDANVRYALLSATTVGGNNYLVRKLENAGGNDLRLDIGVSAYILPAANYSSDWAAGKPLTFIISAANNDLSIWINGRAVAEGIVLPWVPYAPTDFYVGSRYGTANWFLGDIRASAVYNIALTPIQVHDITIKAQQKINDV